MVSLILLRCPHFMPLLIELVSCLLNLSLAFEMPQDVWLSNFSQECCCWISYKPHWFHVHLYLTLPPSSSELRIWFFLSLYPHNNNSTWAPSLCTYACPTAWVSMCVQCAEGQHLAVEVPHFAPLVAACDGAEQNAFTSAAVCCPSAWCFAFLHH